MAESDPIQHIQFGEDVQPVKSAGATVYSTGHKDQSISEKADYDIEDRVAKIADADLNSKKKQASSPYTDL
jgi:hypothetical protein